MGPFPVVEQHPMSSLQASAGVSPEGHAPATRDLALLDLVREVVREELREVLRAELPKLLSAQNMGMSEPKQAQGDGLWDVATACRFLGVSSSWLYHRAAAGTIPCIRVGHNLRFDPEALRAWVRGERRGGRVVPLK
jgi:excisionase family DNA binding protein